MEEVSPSTAFWRNCNALVTCNPKGKYKIDSLENIPCKISNYICKKRRVSMWNYVVKSPGWRWAFTWRETVLSIMRCCLLQSKEPWESSPCQYSPGVCIPTFYKDKKHHLNVKILIWEKTIKGSGSKCRYNYFKICSCMSVLSYMCVFPFSQNENVSKMSYSCLRGFFLSLMIYILQNTAMWLDKSINKWIIMDRKGK